MIRIEHVALWVNDIDAICDFYLRYFDAVVSPQYENHAKGFTSRFLSFESGARIEVMKTTMLSPTQHEAGAQRMGLTHLALSVGSESAVDALINKMKKDGVTLLDGPRRTGDGYYEAVVLDPEGNRVEVMA